MGKVRYILRTEGASSLFSRAARFAAYRGRRAFVSKGANVAAWEALRDRYAGERAFLIGNGPSLNATPLYLLGGERSMCFNRWDLMLERLSWTPTFYVVIDDRVLMDTLDVANDMSARVEYAFFPDIHPYNVDFRKHIIHRHNVRWLYLDMLGFSDCLPYCGINKTVANVGLQILAYLGFQDIYLLGLDMTYAVAPSVVRSSSRDVIATEDDDENHFDPRYFGRGRKFHMPMLEETFEKFEEARGFFAARGMRIHNATVGGAVEVFDRVRLEDVLGCSPAVVREAYLANIRAKLAGDYMDAVHQALRSAALADPDSVPRAPGAWRVRTENMGIFMRRWVSEFVPFGPYEETHMFISRGLLREMATG